jgi:tetratricopeptide (TPR) repeat protein
MDTPSEKKQVELASAYYTKGRKLWSKGDRENALDLFRKALSIQEAVLGTYNKQTARTYYWVGYALSHKQEYNKALVAYRRALRIRLFLFGDDDASTEDVKRALKDVLKEKGFLEKGIEEYLKGIAAAVQHEQEAINYEKRGSHSHTVEEYEKCLAIEEAAPGSFPLDIARLYAKIADVHKMHHDNDMAISAYRDALAIFVSKLGRRHSDSTRCIKAIESCAHSKGLDASKIEQYVSDVYNSIALVKEGDEMKDAGMIDVAVQKYEAALLLEEASLGKEPLSTAEIHRRLASCHRAVQDYDRAIKELRTALAIFIFDNGGDHHTVISCLRELGVTLKENGSDTADMNKYLNTVSYSVKYERYGEHICKEGDYAGAISEFQKAMSLEVSALGKYHLTQAALFKNIAIAFDSQGRHDHAIVNYRNALLICQPKLGLNHPTTLSILGEMRDVAKRKGLKGPQIEEYGVAISRSIENEIEGNALLKHGQSEQAIAAFQKAVALEEESLGQYHLCTLDLYSKMADILKALGELDRALVKYRDLLAVCQAPLGLDNPNSVIALEGLAAILTIKRLEHEVAHQYSKEVVDSINFERTGDDQAKQGSYEEAISSYRQAVQVEQKVLGDSYLTTAGLYSKVADVYRLRGQNNRSILIYRKSIRIYQSYKVPDHDEIDRAMKHLALAVLGLGFNESTAETYQKAVQKSLKLEADGDTAQHSGNYAKAISKYGLAIEEEEIILGKLYPTTSSLYKKIADICRDEEDYESALLFYSKVLSIEESHLGKDHEETLNSFNQLINVSQKYGTKSGASLEGWTMLKYVLMGLIGLLVLIMSVVKGLSNNQRTIKRLEVSAYGRSNSALAQEAKQKRRVRQRPRKLEPPEERYAEGGDWEVDHSVDYSSEGEDGESFEDQSRGTLSAKASEDDESLLDQARPDSASVDGISFAEEETVEDGDGTMERTVDEYEFEERTVDSLDLELETNDDSSSLPQSVSSTTSGSSGGSDGKGGVSIADRLAAWKKTTERPSFANI